jgi:hypothetical protein
VVGRVGKECNQRSPFLLELKSTKQNPQVLKKDSAMELSFMPKRFLEVPSE